MILIGYVLTLCTAVAGVVAFPFSMIPMVLLFVVVGVFFVVAVAVIVMTYVFFAIGICHALMALGRRLLFGEDSCAESYSMSKSPAPEQTDHGLWDQWIDGVW